MKTGEKLRFLRQFNDFSQKQMAESLNMEARSYNNLENDKVKVDILRIEQVVKLFGLDASEFIKIKDTEELKDYLLAKRRSTKENALEEIKEDQLAADRETEITEYVTIVNDLANSLNELINYNSKTIYVLNKLEILKNRNKNNE